MTNSSQSAILSPQTKFLVAQGGVSDELITLLDKEDFNALFLSYGNWSNLSDLLPFRSKIRKLNIRDGKVDWKVVDEFSNLVALEVSAKDPIRLSFRNFPHMKFLDCQWHDGMTDGVLGLKTLEGLVIRGWKQSHFTSLSSLGRLRYLSLFQSKFLESLGHIESESLKGLSMYGLQNLKDVSGMEKIKKLEVAKIESCKKIDKYEGLYNCTKLINLVLSNSSDLNSIDFLKNNKKMTYVRITDGTIVLDGRVAQILNHPSILRADFTNARHYDMDAREIARSLKEKNPTIDNRDVFRDASIGFKEV